MVIPKINMLSRTNGLFSAFKPEHLRLKSCQTSAEYPKNEKLPAFKTGNFISDSTSI